MAQTGREDAVTIRGVTREAGVAPQSFYLHFETLDALLWEVYAQEFATLADRLAAAASGGDNQIQRLHDVCDAYCTFALQRSSAYRLMFAIPGVPEHEWHSELPGTTAFAILRNAVEACLPEGGPKPDLATRRTVLLWTGLHGILTLRNDRPAFPWPPLQSLVEDLITAVTATP